MNASAKIFVSEFREFASFSKGEERYIARSLAVGLGQGDAFELWARDDAEKIGISKQYQAYRELRFLRDMLPQIDEHYVDEAFMGKLIKVSAFDLGQGKLKSFAAYRFLYERLLGAESRPWLPGAFLSAAALPQIPSQARKDLLQSISQAAATSPGWSATRPAFFPKCVDKVELGLS